VRNLNQLVHNIAADQLCWRIGPAEVRVIVFELRKLGQQLIVLQVGDLGCRIVVVQAIVAINFVDELLHAAGNGIGGHETILGHEKFINALGRPRWSSIVRLVTADSRPLCLLLEIPVRSVVYGHVRQTVNHEKTEPTRSELKSLASLAP